MKPIAVYPSSIFYCSVLLISLQSFSTYKFLPFFLITLGPLVYSLGVRRELLISTVAISAFAVAYTLPGVSIHTQAFDAPYFRSALIGIIFCGFIWSLCAGNRKLTSLMIKAIRFALFVNVTFFFLQLILLYAAGFHLDLVRLVTGIESRIEGPPLSFGFKLWRPSGLTFEPGTYVTYMAPLLFLTHLSRGKIDRLQIATLVSFILSLSVFGIIFVAIYMFVVSWSIFRKSKIAILVLSLFVVAVSALIYQYISWRFFSGRVDVSLQTKLHAVQFWLSSTDQRKVLGSFFSYNDCGCLVRDSSLAFNLLFTLGIFGLLFISSWLAFAKGWKTKCFVGAILLSKIPIFSPIFWFFLFGSLCFRRFLSEDSLCNFRKSSPAGSPSIHRVL